MLLLNNKKNKDLYSDVTFKQKNIYYLTGYNLNNDKVSYIIYLILNHKTLGIKQIKKQ